MKILLLLLFFMPNLIQASGSEKWISGYYAGWMYKHLPPEQIDYTALTHLMHFSALPNADGSLDLTTHKITVEQSAAVIERAHANNKKVLLSVGGSNFRKQFISASSEENREYFIANLLTILKERGYDGIDIDWEPLRDEDNKQYADFIKELRSRLNDIDQNLLLTSALMGNDYQAGALVHPYLNQVNVMTYSLADPAWLESSWHSASIYGGRRDGSIDNIIADWLVAGVPSEKIGIGMIFYGKQWLGVRHPGESTKAVTAIKSSIPYYKIVNEYFPQAKLEWDDQAKASYLSKDYFLSFDSEVTAREKVKYLYDKNLGGMILWEIGAGYMPDTPEGERNPLLKSIQEAIADNEKVDTTYKTRNIIPIIMFVLAILLL